MGDENTWQHMGGNTRVQGSTYLSDPSHVCFWGGVLVQYNDMATENKSDREKQSVRRFE
jgi:hypothetical protein